MTNPYLSLLRTSWTYAHGEQRRFLLIYSLLTGSNLLLALEPLLWGWLVGVLQVQGTAVLRYTWLYIGAYLCLQLAARGMNGPARVMERDLAYRIGYNFMQGLVNETLHLPASWHEEHHSGATINRLRKAYDSLRYFYERGSAYLQSIVRFTLSIGAMIYFAPVYGLLATAMGVATIALIRRFDRPTIGAMREVQEREHTFVATLLDSLTNILTVITLRLERRMETGVLSRISSIFPAFHRYVALNEWKWFAVGLSISLIYVVILGGYIHQNWAPGELLPLGGLVALVGFVGNFNSVFNNIAWQYSEVVRYNTEVETVQSIREAYRQRPRPATSASTVADWQEVHLAHLMFHYPSPAGENAGLQDVHLRFSRGQRIALVGESGSGKSTLLALLRGLYPVTHLDLQIDGRSYPLVAPLADQATLLPQDPEIFENTIGYNLTLGLPFPEADIERACKLAQFSEVIAQLPNGLQSHIQEKGVNLSGGQKQRLALARGILAARDSTIVLLDEPTSSLDPRTEQLIYDHLFDEFRDKTIISAMHRLHLLRRFDYIYVLEKGRIAGEGTLAQLLAGNALFRELWQHQQS